MTRINNTLLDDFLYVHHLLLNMANGLACEKETNKMAAGVEKKLNHAKQILTGKSSNGTIKRRHENWQNNYAEPNYGPGK